MKNILVTGGAGFIGSHLCAALLKQGNRVVSIDNFNDYYDPSIKRENIERLKRLGNRALVSLEADIRSFDTVDRIFTEYMPGFVVHLAACAGVRPSIEKPLLYTETNVNGTVNILECSKRHGVAKLVFASSSSVYGNNKKVPFNEDDRVDSPISPYAATKKAGELLCHTYSVLYGMHIACLRFFTVYGPGQRPDLAIHKFSWLIDRSLPIPFYGNGETRRDYTYIDDIIDGVLKSMEWVSGGNGYDVFNLGESRTISLRDMVETLENALDRKARLDRLSSQPGDVEITYADIAKAKRVLGYSPNTEFEEGIRRFIEWYRGEGV